MAESGALLFLLAVHSHSQLNIRRISVRTSAFIGSPFLWAELRGTIERKTHLYFHSTTDRSSPFEPLLDTDEAAGLLQVHPKTLGSGPRAGRVPAFNLGRWRFRASDLDEWLKRSVHSNAANSAA